MLVDQTPPPSTGVRAAEIIINQAAKAIELKDIEPESRSWSAPPEHRNEEAGGEPSKIDADITSQRS